MPVRTLKANHYLWAPFTVPQNKTVIVDMEVEGLVDLYVVLNEQELTEFKSGQRPINRAALGIMNYYSKINLASLGSMNAPRALGQTSPLTFLGLLASSPLPGSTWYLVIVNRSQSESIAIFYRVYNA